MGKFKINNFYLFYLIKIKLYFRISILTITALLVTNMLVKSQQDVLSNILLEISQISTLVVKIPG